jgi:hypothetical protein
MARYSVIVGAKINEAKNMSTFMMMRFFITSGTKGIVII